MASTLHFFAAIELGALGMSRGFLMLLLFEAVFNLVTSHQQVMSAGLLQEGHGGHGVCGSLGMACAVISPEFICALTLDRKIWRRLRKLDALRALPVGLLLIYLYLFTVLIPHGFTPGSGGSGGRRPRRPRRRLLLQCSKGRFW